MKLNEKIKYSKGNYQIIMIYGLGTNSIYILLRFVFDIKIYVLSFSTFKEAKEYLNNIY